MTKRPSAPPPPPDPWTRPRETTTSLVWSIVIPVVIAAVLIGLGFYLEVHHPWAT